MSTPNGQVTVSLDGQLPPGWPSSFPVPAKTTAAGSGSVAGSASATKVAVYSTGTSAADAFSFYTSNSTLTTSGAKSVGAGGSYVGSASITAPYTGSVTVAQHSGTTYIIVVLTSTSTTTTT